MLYCIKYTDRQTDGRRSDITSSRAPVGAKNSFRVILSIIEIIPNWCEHCSFCIALSATPSATPPHRYAKCNAHVSLEWYLIYHMNRCTDNIPSSGAPIEAKNINLESIIDIFQRPPDQRENTSTDCLLQHNDWMKRMNACMAMKRLTSNRNQTPSNEGDICYIQACLCLLIRW